MTGVETPAGGGALRGIGETFQPDLHTGTATITVPIPLPAGRGRLTPTLELRYDSARGNGPFGLGWTIGTPAVRRRTDRGVPRYAEGTDTFVLCGTEELVAVAPAPAPGLTRYRPRTEAAYARILHHAGPAGDYWEVRSAGGLRSLYGTPQPAGEDPAVIRTPAGEVYGWLLSETADLLGNRIRYVYEGFGGVQRYLTRIQYADHGDPADPEWAVTVLIHYDDAGRPDPFSDRRPGFELRTDRRADRIEVWTPGSVDRPATEVLLRYADETAEVSLLAEILVRGIDGDNEQALPPIGFSYRACVQTPRWVCATAVGLVAGSW